MMRTRIETMWRDLVADPEAICALSLGNVVVLWLLMALELWLHGGR
jgi:hypothetical protein